MATILLTLALAGALSPVLAAPRDEHGVTFSVAGGYIWMDPAENLDSTWAGVARLGYGLNPRWTLESDFGLHQGQTRTEFGYGYDLLSPRLNVLFNLAPEAPVEPFLTVGGGILHKRVRRDPDTYEEQSPEGTNLGNFKNPDTDGLINGGWGLLVPLNGPVSLRGDFRGLYNLGTEPHGEIDDAFLDWEITGGFCFRGSELRKDTDGDGILDRDDECPTDPEDYDRHLDQDGCPDPDNDGDGIIDDEDDCPDTEEDFDRFRDSDGCPEDDNDNDGIVDWQDDCPVDAEDLDGFRDRDGCPDEDNDGDGLLDLQDDCPNKAEDFDGWRDGDGCLDDDNDGDGIGDEFDACPNSPETYNDVEDEDGCPDEFQPPPPEMERFTGVIHGINFKVDSDEITVDSYRILDEAASVLNKFPEVRIEVQGHTDSDGSDEYNIDLSDRRARSVVKYLMGRGVDPERLSWAGFGESRPLVEETSKDAKAVNRRVEFHILQDDTADLAP